MDHIPATHRIETALPLPQPAEAMAGVRSTGTVLERERQLSGILLTDVTPSRPFLDAAPGPACGVAGTRRPEGVERLPPAGTIVKPSVGLMPGAIAASASRLIRSARACPSPLDDDAPRLATPVFSSGRWAGQAVDTSEALGSRDLIDTCGDGIVGPPDGVEAGRERVRAAWKAARGGETPEARAARSPAVATAPDSFG